MAPTARAPASALVALAAVEIGGLLWIQRRGGRRRWRRLTLADRARLQRCAASAELRVQPARDEARRHLERQPVHRGRHEDAQATGLELADEHLVRRELEQHVLGRV